MLLAVSPSVEFIRFLQILAWIVAAALLLVILLTVILHYRKRKRQKIAATDIDFILASPEKFNHNISDGEYICFDHSGLISEYKKRMFYSEARYRALRNDYNKLETKYSLLNNDPAPLLLTNKKDYMKNRQEQSLEMKTDALPVDLALEKKELLDKLEQLNRSCQRLEEENRFLQEQANLQSGDEQEKESIINRWKEEILSLRDKIAEQDYLAELLEEKKSQIGFLQNQLEQRIKNQHHSEQQRLQAIAGIEEVQKQAEAAREELHRKQESEERLQSVIDEKEEQLVILKQTLANRMDQLTYLENVLQETRQQNELLNAEAADNRDLVRARDQQLSDEKARTKYVEQKLHANKQLLRRLHKEFSDCLEDDLQQSPVITLRKEEWAEG